MYYMYEKIQFNTVSIYFFGYNRMCVRVCSSNKYIHINHSGVFFSYHIMFPFFSSFAWSYAITVLCLTLRLIEHRVTKYICLGLSHIEGDFACSLIIYHEMRKFVKKFFHPLFLAFVVKVEISFCVFPAHNFPQR